MLAVVRIVNKNYWKSIFGPFITFVLPIVYTWIISSIYYFQLSGSSSAALTCAVLPTAFFLSPTIVLLIMLPQAIFEIKSSVLIKRLKVSSVKTYTVFLASVTFYMIVALASYLTGVLLSRYLGVNADCRAQTQWMLSMTNWGSVTYAIFIHIVLTASLGLLILSVARAPSTIPLFGFAILIFSLVLAGLMCPIQLASQSNKFLWHLSYIDPLRYSSMLSYESFFSQSCAFNTYGTSIFQLSANYEAQISSLVDLPIKVLGQADKVANIFAPLAFIVAFSGLSIKLFKM